MAGGNWFGRQPGVLQENGCKKFALELQFF
jgi:hypothetical protein